MKIPHHIPLKEFSYHLPDEKIARFPVSPRDHSKLLVFQKGKVSEKRFFELPDLLSGDHHLVFNNSRVIHARLHFEKPGGAKIEVFCLEPYEPVDHQLSFSQQGSVVWKCLIGNARKWKNEELIKIQKDIKNQYLIKAKKIEKRENAFLVSFSWEPASLTFSEVLALTGETPIPPYLKRKTVTEDSHTYQTVYSKHEGSVAAPTAGLHFTSGLLKRIKDQGIEKSQITLHVGAGTFTPVKSSNMKEHPMHTERFAVNRKTLKNLIDHKKNIIAVGTTSSRTLESLYWIGHRLPEVHLEEGRHHLSQYEAYRFNKRISRTQALKNILKFMEENKQENFLASTSLMITPGYEFQMTDGLITNFHQPGSTLLLLIAAFTGEEWKNIYRYALEHEFRFLSYGDSSILLP